MLTENQREKLERFCCFKILLLVTACYLCYGDSLNGSFVFDDTVAIKQNKAILEVPTNYTAIFTSDFWGADLSKADSHKSYRPLTSLMFHWEWVRWKLEPRQMKIINVGLHAINCVLVLLFLERLEFTKSSSQVALYASLLFAVHPVHTEAVSGIVSRADLMYCLIYLNCLLMCCTHQRHNWCSSLLVITLTCIGVLFKETAITIPLACATVNYGIDRLYKHSWQQQMRSIFCRKNLCYALSTIALLLARLWVADFKSPKFRVADNHVAHSNRFTTRLFSQNYLYVYNVYILINPLNLCFDWSFGCIQLVDSVKDYRLLFVFSLYLIIAVIVLKFKQNFTMTMAMCLFVVPFLPASGIIRVGFVIAERVLYAPSVGFCYMIAYGFKRLCENYRIYKKFVQFAYFLTVLVFILRCRQRSRDWLTEEKLFSSALDVCPNNAKVHYNIARLATDFKDNAKAFFHYHKAIELSPDYDAALMNLGNLYRKIGNLAEAENYLQQSLEVTPDFATAWMNLGIVQSALKQYTKALESYNNALKYRKNYANCFYNMGNLYLDQHDFTNAHRHWQHAVALNPRLQNAWTNILTMLDSKGMYEDAIRMSDQALKYLPDENPILFLRANVLGKQLRYIEAEVLYKRIVTKEPMNYLYHTNLAILYHRWNRITDAIESYKNALKANRKKATTARDNLSKIIKRFPRGKTENIYSHPETL